MSKIVICSGEVSKSGAAQIEAPPVEADNPNPAPPPPPPNTNKGYNPALDKPRPAKIENYLKFYDVTIIIDDSGSMNVQGRWAECLTAVMSVANKAIDNGATGIEFHFFNNPGVLKFKDQIRGVADKSKVSQFLNSVTPSGGDLTRQKLQGILQERINLLNQSMGTPEYGKTRPMDLIIITDGTLDATIGPEIQAAAKLVEDAHHHPNAVYIQFVQIGNDPSATQTLTTLGQGDYGGMVSTVPYNGTALTPERFEQVLLSGVQPSVHAARRK
jgi:hypothetical protein